tara:strand:+ start:185 stop:967 length:783 start_codon:yes stop_codon:yes gene_type:complete
MPAPNFFILGAQKAGTTYLAKALSSHPDVLFSEPKELMFFSRPKINKRDFRTYKDDYFSVARREKWVGEGSTTYLQWPDALPNLQTYIEGQPKFIVCLRQPTEKAVSFFIHNWRRDRYAPGTTITDTLDEYLGLSPLGTGLYAPSLRRWLDAYPRENFCFMKFDHLQATPDRFVRKATDFLGIAPSTDVPNKLINAGLPLIWENGQLTIASKVDDDQTRPVFTVEELEALHARFQSDIAETAELTDLPLNNWAKIPTFAS